MVQASTAYVTEAAQRDPSSTAGGPPEAAGAQLPEERPDQRQDPELDDEEDFEMAGEAEEPDDEATLEEEEVGQSALHAQPSFRSMRPNSERHKCSD